MKNPFINLESLETLNRTDIEKLHRLSIRNLSDLLAYQPIRYAQLIQAASECLLHKDEIKEYLDRRIQGRNTDTILISKVENIKGVGPKIATVLNELGIYTIADLADYPPFIEAEKLITKAVSDENDPYAPDCVLPECKKFTRNQKRFVSFFKQEEIRNLSILSSGSSFISHLFRFGRNEKKIIYLGYSTSYLQEWIYFGVHLGEPQGSVNLSMGQDSQVSVLDWRRTMNALRQENTRVSERLSNTLFHQRAVDEVARATAEEHQFGGTSAFGANAATAGSFAAAGAIVGGIGGGVTGALSGLALDALLLGTDAGLGTLTGAAVGTAVGSMAGAAAGSLVFSGATTLGFVETDVEGNREIFGRSAQNIQQNTIQNSSSIRSFWSNIISQSVEKEQQTIRTERVTNHNRIHALNALYYEVLNEYKVTIKGDSFSPILFLPFKPISFNESVLRKYWWLIRTYLRDGALIKAIDEYFTPLSSDPAPVDELAELPEISDIRSTRISVEVNLDGSRMEDIIKNSITSFFTPTLFANLLNELYNNLKRENIEVNLITTDGTKRLRRITSPNADPNYIGTYETTSPIPIHTIEQIQITNKNSEFNLLNVIHINKLAFENISAQVFIRNKSKFSDSLPALGSLENKDIIQSSSLVINGNRSKTISWDIASRLRDLFEGIEEARSILTEAVEEAESIGARISKLLNFLNANKYGFTRIILDRTEREQLIKVLEDVEIGGIELSKLASTTPIGFCGNHVVLPLKNCTLNSDKIFVPIRLETKKLEFYLYSFEQSNPENPKKYISDIRLLLSEVSNYLSSLKDQKELNNREKQLINLIKSLQLHLEQFLKVMSSMSSASHSGSSIGNFIEDAFENSLSHITSQLSDSIEESINRIRTFLNNTTQTNQEDISRLCEYYSSVKDSLNSRMGKLISSDEVSLPSPAVFMEPVLSQSKGAELYDMRRNSHWQVLSSPEVGTADPNVIRARDITLQPNEPTAGLSIQNSPEYPLSDSISAALTQAGRLDLNTLLNTNAGTLNNTLSGLASMATELAKASTQLTGDAQKQALDSASNVAKQVSDIITKSIQPDSQKPPSPAPAPQTQQEKAEVRREAERIGKSKATAQQKQEQKKTIGAATVPDNSRDYQFSITFLDHERIPYAAGSFQFTLTLSLFELGTVVDINGGGPLDIAPEGFFFPEQFTLTKGRKIKLSLVADIGGVNVPGAIDIPLPDTPDIAFECIMDSETREIQATTVKEAVDKAVQTSKFGINAGILLDLFLNAGAKFPFQIAEVDTSGAIKTVLDLKNEYNLSTTTTAGGTTSSTTLTTYKVTTPLNGWKILMK